MDKYIKQLLLLHSKIILPQFGAIVIENEETGELMFNEYLSYDDGKLSELIEKESNMDLQAAQNMVAKFVRELQAQLDKGETYSIYQLGHFNKNEEGEFSFIGNIKTGGGESPSNEPKQVTPVVAPIASNDKKEAQEIHNKKKEEKSDASKKNIYVEKKDAPVAPVAIPAKDVKPVKEAKKEKPVKIKKEKIKKEKVKVPPKVKTPKAPRKPGEENNKNRPLLWIIIILLLLVATASILIGLNYDKVEEYMGWNKFENVEQVKPIEEEKIPEETVIDEVEEEPITEEPAAPITSSKGNHHIIVGCFNELSNAQGLVNDYKQQGFDAKIVGQYGGLNFVSAQSYPSASQAYADLSRVRQITSQAWIFRN